MQRLILLLICIFTAVSAYAAPNAANGLVVLLTDYGADSIYVGAIKGAIYTKFPEARVDTLTNSIPPYDIATGARILAEGSKEFPRGTTFCCVVDPGVGTPRKRILLETKAGQFFIAPDNGLLSIVAKRDGAASIHEAANAAFWRNGAISNTFQGRDIFGPVAAAIAHGVSPAEIGPELKEIMDLKLAESRVENEAILGEVVRVDDYGNMVTNIPAAQLDEIDLKPDASAEVSIGGVVFRAPRKSTYSDVPTNDKIIVIQSSGAVEIAINRGNLAKEISQSIHAEVKIQKAK
jgi:S-adenosylmethionine hydrolase